MSDIAQHLAVSHKVEFEDLDWETAKKIGLTQQEVDSLLYFADIESQTVHYFLEVSKLKVARDPELLTFLTMWNYEEYFHSYAITHALERCGVDVKAAHERASEVRAGARFKAKFEDFAQVMVEFIQRLSLGMCPWKSGNIPDVETGIRAAFNNGGEGMH